MEEIVETVHFISKERLKDTLEKLYYFRETNSNNQINDKSTIKPAS